LVVVCELFIVFKSCIQKVKTGTNREVVTVPSFLESLMKA
jgi:hypothetical protein